MFSIPRYIGSSYNMANLPKNVIFRLNVTILQDTVLIQHMSMSKNWQYTILTWTTIRVPVSEYDPTQYCALWAT